MIFNDFKMLGNLRKDVSNTNKENMTRKEDILKQNKVQLTKSYSYWNNHKPLKVKIVLIPRLH